MPYPNIEEKDNSIESKSKTLHPTNICNENVDYEINDSHCVIPITNIISIENGVWSMFVIQSRNGIYSIMME
jgi:hypothetical protein